MACPRTTRPHPVSIARRRCPIRRNLTACWPIPNTWSWSPEGLAEGRTYVAEEQGSLVGFATWAEAGGIAELEDLFVDPVWRRRGIATALVSRIAQILRARGAESLEVTANPHAMGFYRATGFVDCGITVTDLGTAPRMVLAIQ